jgi:hypothetical protein
VVVCLTLGGCARGINPPSLDPKAATQKAMELYDTNKDGSLDAKELDQSPGLKSCLAAWDQDKDGRLSQSEIEAGLTAIAKTPVGLASATCRVFLDKKPLEGASVTFEPEPFVGSAF